MFYCLNQYGPNSMVSALLVAFVVSVVAATMIKVWQSIQDKQWRGIVKALVMGLALLALPLVALAMIALSAEKHGNY